METYQRDAVALIRDSGARLSILHDHRLLELWREYSQRVYNTGWIKAYTQEVYRFVTWTNGLPGIGEEIQAARLVWTRKAKGIPVRAHNVRAWDHTELAGTRFG